MKYSRKQKAKYTRTIPQTRIKDVIGDHLDFIQELEKQTIASETIRFVLEKGIIAYWMERMEAQELGLVSSSVTMEQITQWKNDPQNFRLSTNE
jgi:hypothetical protein